MDRLHLRRYQKVSQLFSAFQGFFDLIINSQSIATTTRAISGRTGTEITIGYLNRRERKRSDPLSCCSGDQSVRPFIISIFEASLSKEHRGRRRRHCRHSLKYRQPPSSPLSTKEKGRSGRPVFGREPNRTEPIKYYIVVASPFGRSVMSR